MTLETRSTAVCAHCRKDFSPHRCDRVFCSAACRQAAYRVRKEAAEVEAEWAAEEARRRKETEAAAERSRAIAEQREAERATEAAKKRADFIASLIG
jgi:hypothetical protein